jgi:major membrane immunogen (membrane-anchored lipoprotein)
MKKIFLSVIVAMLIVSMPLYVKAEEKETTTYSFDFSQYNGGSPDDYQYSFDKENWTSERTWEVEVGKMYKLYVKYPDGYIALISTFVPEADNKIEESTSVGEDNQLEIKESTGATQETEAVSETEITTDVDNNSEQAEEKGWSPVVFVLIILIVVFACVLGVGKNLRRK